MGVYDREHGHGIEEISDRAMVLCGNEEALEADQHQQSTPSIR